MVRQIKNLNLETQTYHSFITDIKQRIRSAQYAALMLVSDDAIINAYFILDKFARKNY